MYSAQSEYTRLILSLLRDEAKCKLGGSLPDGKRKVCANMRKPSDQAKVVKAKLQNAPTVELVDEAADVWQEYFRLNTDPYGRATVTFAERWARLMQLEMSQGKTLAEVAEATDREADFEGITGFMYGCAVSMLAKCWKHGEELRRWHNLKTQFRDEGVKANETGGVLNPALLTISPSI